MDNAFFEQAVKNIRHLIAEKKFKEAYESCKKQLFEFPEEEVFLNLQTEIEEATVEYNEEYIKTKLKEIKPMWKEEKYAELLKELTGLLAISPEDKKLKKLVEKAQLAYKKQIDNMQGDFNKRQSERLNKVLKENPKQLIEELFMLDRENSDNPAVKQLTDSYRDKLIDKKIQDMGDLVYSTKFDAIENFIGELEKIRKENPRIEEIRKTMNARKHSQQVHKSQEFEYQGMTHLDTLMKLKKYDKVMKAAKELLSVNKTSKKIHSIYKKAKAKLFAQTRDLSVDSIRQNLPKLKADLGKDPKKFVKL